jgi:hypothetical protein
LKSLVKYLDDANVEYALVADYAIAPVLAALPSQFPMPIMCEVERLLSDAPLRIRVDGLESRRSYAET